MKKNNSLLAITFFLFVGASSCDQQAGNKWTIASPSGALHMTLTEQQGKLSYFVMIDADTIIRRSALGIDFADESFTEGLEFTGSVNNRINEYYSMVTGKRKNNHAIGNETVVSFKNSKNTTMQLVMRAYDDGVAFCYRFPDNKREVKVTKEWTSFTLPSNGKAWLQPYGLPAQWAPSYEEMYHNGIPVGQPARDSSGYSFAALFKTYKHWLLLTESGLDENFYGSHLQPNCDNGVYKIAAPQTGEAQGLYPTYAVVNTSFSTPWRTIIAGASPATIVESNIVHHLSQPSKITDMSWIRTGRSSWSWWSDHPSSKNYNSLKKYVDLSKKMGWEYSLVDANWNIMKGGNIAQLIEYAEKQGIGLALWYNSAGPHSTIAEQPRDIMNDPLKRKAEFKKLREWGIKTVKVDFFNSDKQEMMKLYLDILKDAAEEHIMIDTHGCTLPRGWARTWPNLVAMEGVHGAEQYNWDTTFAKESPKQNIIYAFTRNVVGSMDYTPVTFSSYPCCQHATSNAYELALSVLFESGITHFADGAENYLKTDSSVRSFLRTVPSAWDDTRFIQGYPGKELLLARQKGQDWYIGGVNGETIEKNFKLDFSFLPKGNYKLTILKDGKTTSLIESQELNYTTGDPLTIKVLPNGGFAVRAKRRL